VYQLRKSEFCTVQSAVETTKGVQATAGWRQHEPNPGGIGDFYADLKKVRRSPISRRLQHEKGSVVGLSTSPKLTMDLTKDVIEQFGEAWFRSATYYPSSTGVGKFAVTDVTATGYTVAAGGALAQNILIFAAGFANAANNGLKVLGAGSTATEIKTSGLVVENPAPAGAVVYVCGVQGAANDIGVNASQHLTSTAGVFDDLALAVGQWIWLGGGTAASPGLLGFTVAPQNRGFARIAAIPAGGNQLQVDRRTQAWATDAGSGGKTIQIFYGPWLRNLFGDDGNYKEPSYSLELSFPGAAAAGATSYVYGLGECVDQVVFNAPSEEKALVEMSFLGFNLTDPTTVRATGANTPSLPFANGAFTTANEVRRLRVAGVDESGISSDIFDWKLTIQHGLKPQVQQGTLGAKRMVFGKFTAMLDLTVVFVQDDVCKAIRDNRTCQFDVAMASADGAVLFDVPGTTLDDGAPNIQENDYVTLPTTAEGFRDPKYNWTAAMQLFPFLPPS
jgi:hypothetical protein